MPKPIVRRRSHALNAPVKLKSLSYNLTPRPRATPANHRGAFPRSSIRGPLFTVPASEYEQLFVNKCEGRHTTKNFSHGANYKKNIRRRAPIPGITPQGRFEACRSIFLFHNQTPSTRNLGNNHGRGSFEARSLLSAKLQKGGQKGILREFFWRHILSFDRGFIYFGPDLGL